MSDYDMDVEDTMDEQDSPETKPAARVKRRRLLEDYLLLNQLRQEFDYFTTNKAIYSEDELFEYGLGDIHD